jgi:hypothetical protein
VDGVASGVPISITASASEAEGAYRQAMTEAVQDGQGKAEFLASKVGATLGPAQTVSEGSGGVECRTAPGEAGEYVSYEGVQPDFARREAGVAVAPEEASASKPAAIKPRKKKSKRKGAHAASVTCTVATDVALSYVIE